MMEPTYRIDHSKRRTTGDTMWEISGSVDFLIEEGILVPDTEKQDIADAWNNGGRYQTATRVSLRVAWPELAALLDALNGDNDE